MTHTPTAVVRAADADALDGDSPATAVQLVFLAGKVDALRAEVEALTEKQTEIAGMLSTVVEQVGPTLDQLSSHPMFKMIFGGK